MTSLLIATGVATTIFAAAFIAFRLRRKRRILHPNSRMRLSEREVAELARLSVQRFLQDTHDARV